MTVGAGSTFQGPPEVALGSSPWVQDCSHDPYLSPPGTHVRNPQTAWEGKDICTLATASSLNDWRLLPALCIRVGMDLEELIFALWLGVVPVLVWERVRMLFFTGWGSLIIFFLCRFERSIVFFWSPSTSWPGSSTVAFIVLVYNLIAPLIYPFHSLSLYALCVASW